MNYSLDQQLILLQNLKERQENEIINMQQYEAKMQEIRKTNDLKYKERQEHNEMLEKEKQYNTLYNKKSKEQEKFLMQQSLYRKNQIEHHINMNKQLNIYVVKQPTVDTQELYEQKLINDAKLQDVINLLTKPDSGVEKAKQKVQENNAQLRQDLERKNQQKELENKFKQDYIDEKKQLTQFDQEKKKLQFDQKLTETKAKNEQQKNQIRQEYDLKQRKIEERRKEEEQERKKRRTQEKK